MSKLLKSIFSYILGALLITSLVTLAGTLTPGEGVTTSTTNFYTLSDIYNKLNLNTYSATEHTVSTSSAVVGTMNTLTEIWEKIPTLSASTIATGTTIMGVNGTAYVITGTGTGSIATADQIITDYYAYGDTGTVVQGSATAGTPALEWSADNPAGNVNWATSVSYCDSLEEGGYTDWRLPTAYDFFNVINYSLYNPASAVSPSFQNANHWSSTEKPDNSANVFVFLMSYGSMRDLAKTGTCVNRCVR